MKGKFRMIHRSLPRANNKSNKSICKKEEVEDCAEECQVEETRDCAISKRPEAQEPPCVLPPEKSQSLLEMPHFFRIIGPKQIAIALSYVPPLARYGVFALVALVYITDFQVVLQYLPYYNGIFKKESEENTVKNEVKNKPKEEKEEEE